MSLQSIPFFLGAVAVVSFFAAAVLYFLLKAKPLEAWKRHRLARRSAKSSAMQQALEAKRVAPENAADGRSSLMKILDHGLKETEATPPRASKQVRRPNLPPVPALRANPQPSGTALEAVVVQMYEEYLSDIAGFQRQLSEATSVGEILNKACRSVSLFSRKARVVYLEYQGAQRAMMVTSRSGPEIFAGTQPKMFLPLKSTGRSLANEDLRVLFSNLDSDPELQRLLKDSCLLESRAGGELEADQVWSSRANWKVFPLYVRGIPQGAFAVQENSVCQRREYSTLVEIFLAQASSAIENIRLHSKLVDVSAKDAVTGLQTRKVFGERLQENYLLARRLRHPLTVVRLEIDHMPAYVKQYGASVSEAILRHVTRHLSRYFRKSDIVARHGQDGFAILLPHTALVDALKKIEMVVQGVRESALKLGRQDTAIEIKVSVSAGVSEFPSHADNANDLLRLANESLHKGQSSSRAGVTLARLPAGYVPPFNSRFVRSSPKALQDNGSSPILDP